MAPIKVAAVQATPVFLDLEKTIDKAVGLIGEAAAGGASLVAFPEAFVPGYPDWVWRSTPWSDGNQWYRRLLENAVDVPGPHMERLGEAAREAGAYVAMGVNERDAVGGTLYNTLVYFGPDGSLLGKHRKLMPTGGERIVWGFGDGSTMDVYETPFGRVGGLICWENYMPLARAAMYAQGIDILLAPTWDNADVWLSTLRHIAKEGRIWVVGVCQVLRGSDVPADLPRRDELYGGDDDWMSRGRSAIVNPSGDVVAGPLEEQEGILYADVDAAAARATRYQFDAVGHYARPDVFRLIVDKTARHSVQDEA